MRVRDLRWYILGCIIIIVSYAAIAICFYLSISNGKVQTSMMDIGLRAAKEEAKLVEDRIANYYDIYNSDANDSLIYLNTGKLDESGRTIYRFVDPTDTTKVVQTTDTSLLKGKIFEMCPNQNGLASFFDNLDKKVLFKKSLDIEKANQNPDRTEFFLYLSKKSTSPLATANGNITVRIKSRDLFSEIDRNLIVYNDDGFVEYSNIPGISTQSNVANIFAENYKANYNENGELSYAYSIKELDSRSVVSAVRVDTVGMVSILIDIDDAFLGISWVYQQAIIFYVSGVIVSLLMLGLLILGCRKTSQLLRADRHALQKTEAIVIRIDTAGNIIFSNKTFKKLIQYIIKSS